MRLLFPLLLLLAGCAAGRPVPEPPVRTLRNAEIRADALWRGKIVIDGSVKVFKGATLTILPGTEIAFVRRDEDRDGLGDGTLIVEGALRAVGSREAPIRFRSAAPDPRPGDWLEIRVDFSRQTRLRWCEITDSAYTLHAHFTRGVVEDCVIRRNIDGCRLGQASFVIRNCLVEENEGKGINFRNSSVQLTNNIIRKNGSGIFLFESDRSFTIRDNNLHGNGENFRLGDFYAADVALGANWWGTSDPAEAAATIFDHKRDPALGKVAFDASPEWIAGTGPRDAAALRLAWRFETGAFVDASPAAEGGEVFVPGWDGRLHAFDAGGGGLWSAAVRDVVDAAPALDAGSVYVQNWQREVVAVDRATGKERWRFEYPPSKADDHRQGAPVRTGDLLLVPAWNGTLYALEARSGKARWHFAGGEPLRAAPAVEAETLYLPGGAGTLTALAPRGGVKWKLDLGSSLLTTPAITLEGPVVLTREGLLVSLDRNGLERWRLDLGEPCAYAAPLYRGGALYVGTTAGALWKVEAATGRVLWRRELSGPVYATPSFSEGRILAGDNAGTLTALGENGDILTVFRASGDIQSTPAALGGRIFFGSRDGGIYALDVLPAPLPVETAMPGVD